MNIFNLPYDEYVAAREKLMKEEADAERVANELLGRDGLPVNVKKWNSCSGNVKTEVKHGEYL